jgi:uncharacterized membrane protein
MNRRKKKKHLKKAMKYAMFSIEIAEKYLAKYGLQNEQFKGKYYEIH